MLPSLACLSDTDDDDDESSLFRYRLKKQFRIKRVRRISRRALLDPMETGFIKLYQSGCTQSMITYTWLIKLLLMPCWL
jgi:DNA-binding TFAR19-related protein (PDSD5 family)